MDEQEREQECQQTCLDGVGKASSRFLFTSRAAAESNCGVDYFFVCFFVSSGDFCLQVLLASFACKFCLQVLLVSVPLGNNNPLQPRPSRSYGRSWTKRRIICLIGSRIAAYA